MNRAFSGGAAIPASGLGEPGALLADGAAFIDGHMLPIRHAHIPIRDTGFSRSDVTYDVAAVSGSPAGAS
ncbi:MAG: hypothetical protein ABI323_15145 [Solirubrobacteraceae bacterium]